MLKVIQKQKYWHQQVDEHTVQLNLNAPWDTPLNDDDVMTVIERPDGVEVKCEAWEEHGITQYGVHRLFQTVAAWHRWFRTLMNRGWDGFVDDPQRYGWTDL